VLTATFVRHRGGRDHIYVQRANGTELHWQFPTYGDGLPHDLVHLVVESGLGMTGGFWGLIDDGAEITLVDNEATIVGASDDWSGLRLAEAAVASFGAESSGGVAQNYTIPSSYAPEPLVAIRQRLVALQAEWAALPDRGSLRLTFG
jgi:hypothetical protein